METNLTLLVSLFDAPAVGFVAEVVRVGDSLLSTEEECLVPGSSGYTCVTDRFSDYPLIGTEGSQLG